ncbi:hypothetical protein HG536_0F02870 [Torulaspora globosa]|uniref:6-phosphofructo-2-kinase domain-containing protein n=1 Tax=Torulaspora globosa TaxID=48254 RepID=A0A7G3ZKC6_9SACH|nr:uncharacterized protein HG536_0F02870 [Torulaspora globosa]QLL33962.1 hypothetical protein HG536_0F02870 [Torulaspora globosa]
MAAILSDEEELVNGLGSELLIAPTGNHMARTGKRWSGSGGARLNNLKKPTSDGVHDPVEEYISPGQLYSTESGRLFHAGRILIVLVGLPATAKTLLSVAITRYTRWLGVRTKSFHVSEYRRKEGVEVPDDYFSALPSTKEGMETRRRIFSTVFDEMVKFFMDSKGQLAIYDALNIRRSERKDLEGKFRALNIKVLFIESIMTDDDLVARGIVMASQSSDYKGLSKEKARSAFMQRILVNRPLYEEIIPEEQLSYVKYINFGERLIVNNNRYGYLINKIVFFLMNLREKKGCVYFARCGTSDKDKYIDDELLNRDGLRYSKILTDLVLDRINSRRLSRHGTPNSSAKGSTPIPEEIFSKMDSPTLIPTMATLQRTASRGNHRIKQVTSWDGADEDSFVVWTAPRKRTYDTAKFFMDKGISVRQRFQLQQLHPGVVADLTEEEIKERYPTEYRESLKDRYHYRFPRAESYHDLAVRMEPLLLEMERMRGDILIIGHESTLKVLYGYLMACTCEELPDLNFPRDELIEISFSPFKNTAETIPIPTH